MYSYDVKVRGTLFLWGSAGISIDLQWPLLLTVRNDLFGDAVAITTHSSAAGFIQIGSLQPGECYTLPLLALSGVSATCTTTTNVTCLLETPQTGPAA